MMLALGGWVLAFSGCGLAAAMLRERSSRREAIARACHELRGPLAAVRLGVHLGTRTGQLSGERLRAIELELGRASLALGDLECARFSSTPAPHTCEDIDVQALVADSVEAWRPMAYARDTELLLDWQGATTHAFGDRLRLAQATGNLIANALEHGGGAVLVKAGSWRGGARIEVIDQGQGLPAPVSDLVRRARRGRGRRGRGLAIATAIVEAHGGRLAAAPSEAGARLVIELPGIGGEEAEATGAS
jgi:signal transduction histidine kinase